MATIHVEPFYDPRTFTLTFVVHDPASKDAVVIDPVLDFDPHGGGTWTESVDRVSAYVRDHGLKVHFVLETHAHADHLSAGQLLRQRLQVPIAIGARITAVPEGYALHPRVQQVMAVAEAGEVMPQKSTYFYPEIASGLVLNPLDPAESVPQGAA
mgnify:CR=1 FL=1